MLEDLRAKINEDLPEDIKVFCMLHVSNNFNAKNCTSYREYSYYLPTFLLTSIQKLNLSSPPKEVDEEEKKEEESKQEHVIEMSKGIAKIVRMPGAEDEHEDPHEQLTDRNI